MKNLIVVASLAILAACGGGGGSDAPAPAQAAAVNQQLFTVVTTDRSMKIQGYGSTAAERQLNAATTLAQATAPGTTDYQQLISAAGMKIMLTDEQRNGVVVYAFLTSSGLVVRF